MSKWETSPGIERNELERNGDHITKQQSGDGKEATEVAEGVI